ACVYSNTISWRAENQPVPMELQPRVVFERLFGDGGSAAQRLARLRQNRSILDSVTQEVTGLQKRLGAEDRVKVGDYLETIRDVEQRVQKAETLSGERALELPERPIATPETFD